MAELTVNVDLDILAVRALYYRSGLLLLAEGIEDDEMAEAIYGLIEYIDTLSPDEVREELGEGGSIATSWNAETEPQSFAQSHGLEKNRGGRNE